MPCFAWDAGGSLVEFLPDIAKFYCLIFLGGDEWVDEMGIFLSGMSKTFVICGLCASLDLRMSYDFTLDPPSGSRSVVPLLFGGGNFELIWTLSVLPSLSVMFLQ